VTSLCTRSITTHAGASKAQNSAITALNRCNYIWAVIALFLANQISRIVHDFKMNIIKFRNIYHTLEPIWPRTVAQLAEYLTSRIPTVVRQTSHPARCGYTAYTHGVISATSLVYILCFHNVTVALHGDIWREYVAIHFRNKTSLDLWGFFLLHVSMVNNYSPQWGGGIMQGYSPKRKTLNIFTQTLFTDDMKDANQVVRNQV
jgi:hypothetical protein